MPTIDLDMEPHQEDFLSSDTKFTLLSGGIGSGKTWAGSHYVIDKAINDSKPLGFIGANTYKQLMNSTLAGLFRELNNMGIPYKFNEKKGILRILNTNIICGSLDNWKVHEGIEIGWFWIDEVRNTDPDAFKMLIGRLRDKSAKTLDGRLTTAPNGFDWLYDYFVGDKKNTDFRLITAASQDNTNLPDGYLETLVGAYDSKLYRQEVLGEFINIRQGQIYYGFNRNRNVGKVIKRPDLRIWGGVDFNINPMTASMGQTVGNVIYIFDEFHIMTSNTRELAKEIYDKHAPYTDEKGMQRHRKIRLVPDSTGRAMKTSSAGLSDHQILEEEKLEVMDAENPRRVDRYNGLNYLMENERVIIDESCVNLIKDLESTVYKEGSDIPDTKDPMRTHCSDNLGYLAWWLYPFIEPEHIGVSQYA